MYLRQSTASQEICLGRFVDDADGNTEETGLTIANTDIKLFKGGATSLASKNSGGATHMANGLYSAVLDATDTDTLGNLEVHVHVAGALAIKREFVVLPANVYDSLVAGSAEIGATALTTTIADSTPADGSRPSAAQALLMITRFLTGRAVSGTSMTVKKEDGSTTAFVITLNDPSTPTSYSRTT